MCDPNMWTKRYLDVTTNHLGWPVEALRDGAIVVSAQNGRFVIENTAPGDPEYLHVYALWDIPSDVDRGLLARIAAEVTIRAKGFSAALLKDSKTVIFSYEAPAASSGCLPTVERLVAVLPRMERMLWNAVGMWFEKIQAAKDLEVRLVSRQPRGLLISRVTTADPVHLASGLLKRAVTAGVRSYQNRSRTGSDSGSNG